MVAKVAQWSHAQALAGNAPDEGFRMILAIFLVLMVLVVGFGSILYGFMYLLEWYGRREAARKERLARKGQ